MNEIPVLVTFDTDANPEQLKALCERHGLTQVRMLPRLGVLKGLLDQKRMAELAKVSGVRSVEKEREIKLPPPGSPIQ
jgi:hypothetical protein